MAQQFTVSGMIEGNQQKFHQEDIPSYEEAVALCRQLLTQKTYQAVGRDWPYTWTLIEGPNVYESLFVREGEVKRIDYRKQGR